MAREFDNKSWERKYRPLCKKQFAEWNITQCELKFVLKFDECKGGLFRSFAHSLKRIDIDSEEKMMEVILTCNFCHGVIEGNIKDPVTGEFWTKQEMYEIVTTTISERVIW